MSLSAICNLYLNLALRSISCRSRVCLLNCSLHLLNDWTQNMYQHIWPFLKTIKRCYSHLDFHYCPSQTLPRLQKTYWPIEWFCLAAKLNFCRIISWQWPDRKRLWPDVWPAEDWVLEPRYKTFSEFKKVVVHRISRYSLIKLPDFPVYRRVTLDVVISGSYV